MSTVEGESSGATQTAAAAKGDLWTGVDKQQVLGYKPPEFTVHYPLKINCHAATASKDTHNWLHDHGVETLLPPKEYKKLIDGDYPGPASRVYVDAGPKGLDWASKYFTWLFAVDDQMDETDIGMSAGSSMAVILELNLVFLWSFPKDPVIRQNLNKFLDAFPSSELQRKDWDSTTVSGGKLGPFGSCLQSLWETFMETMPEVYNLRLAHSIQDYFLGNLEEARNRQSQTIPTIEDYKVTRRKAGTMLSTLVLVDMVAEVHLPSELYNSDPMQRLLLALNDIVCWHNDIWSVKKEMAMGDVHNLVFLISHEHKIQSYEESALVARQMVYDRITDLEKAAVDLLAITPSAYEHVVLKYITTCQHWVSGAQDFNKVSLLAIGDSRLSYTYKATLKE